MIIRREGAADVAAVEGIHSQAFVRPDGQHRPVEVTLVEQLRASDAWLPRLSLVAEVDGVPVGHVTTTRAHVGDGRRSALGLGPIGVLPDRQGQGIGSALMHAVLAAADACDEPLVGLLGDPPFYGRFGFVPATRLGIHAPDPDWGDYFQVRALSSWTPDLRGGFVYAAPFSDL